MEADSLDAALTAAIRAPAVDAQFDKEVWARIRADDAAPLAIPRTWGTPWWLGALNVVAVAFTAIAVTLALRSMAAKPVAATASTLIEHSTGSVLFALFASAAGLWLALRQTPRANDRWL